MDKLKAEERSKLMSRVKTSNTRPELIVRHLIHRMGYRYRIQNRKLPGSPDIVLTRHRKVIFVHGCFWHNHNCPRGKRPATRTEFWNPKLDRNLKRDQEAVESLTSQGWKVLVVWECETKQEEALKAILSSFLLDH